MFIRITRLLLIIITSIFLGMCIVWWVMRITTDTPLGVVSVGMTGSVLLIFAILGLQFWENRRTRKEEKKREEMKIAAEKEKLAEMKNNV